MGHAVPASEVLLSVLPRLLAKKARFHCGSRDAKGRVEKEEIFRLRSRRCVHPQIYRGKRLAAISSAYFSDCSSADLPDPRRPPQEMHSTVRNGGVSFSSFPKGGVAFELQPQRIMERMGNLKPAVHVNVADGKCGRLRHIAALCRSHCKHPSIVRVQIPSAAGVQSREYSRTFTSPRPTDTRTPSTLSPWASIARRRSTMRVSTSTVRSTEPMLLGLYFWDAAVAMPWAEASSEPARGSRRQRSRKGG